MKWTYEKIQEEILLFMKEQGIDRMPTSNELIKEKASGLGRAITLSGGYFTWADRLGIPMKEKQSKWSNEKIKIELEKSIKILGIKRMPTREDLMSINRNDLHVIVGRTKKYSGWAEELGLPLKSGDTRLGQEYEFNVEKILISKGFSIEQMTTKYPYDILVDGLVKVDVKVANPYINKRNTRVHAFNLSKNKQTCDIYILVLLNEEKDIERFLIIPSHHVRQRMIQIGKESKYQIYQDKFDTIQKYIDFLKTI